MSKNFATNKLRILRNKNAAFAIALILLFATSTVMIVIPQTAASLPPATTQTTGPFPATTPSSWVSLITTTPNGEYRPEPGVTEYPWTLSHYDPSCTNTSPSPAPNTNHTLWCCDNVVSDEMYGSMVVTNGEVFCVSNSLESLFCIDAYTGNVIWTVPIQGYATMGPVIVGNIIYIEGVPGSTYLSAYDMSSGRLLWSFDIANATLPTNYTLEGNAGCFVMGVPAGTVFSDPTIFTQGCYETDSGWEAVHICFEVATIGQGYNWIEKWSWDYNSTGQPVLAMPMSFYDGKVYTTDYSGPYVYCLNATTGTLMWNSTGVAGDVFWQSPTIANGKVYVLSGDLNYVYCLDADTGNLLWRTQLTNSTWLMRESFAYGNLYVCGGSDGNVYALNPDTGAVVWTQTVDGTLSSSVTADGKVYFGATLGHTTGFPYFGTYPGVVYCVNATTGEPIWNYTTDANARPVAVADGYLYVETELGNFYCFGPGPTTTTLTPATLFTTVGNAVVLSGSVTDESPFSQQNPTLQSPCVSGVPVILSYIASDGTWTDFGNTTTNSAGQFTYTFTPPSTGAYTLVARFEGTNAYYWSSAETSAVQVNPAPSAPSATPVPIADTYFVPAIVGLFVLIIVVAIVLALLMLRKKP